jgi:hypothetical protein
MQQSGFSGFVFAIYAIYAVNNSISPSAFPALCGGIPLSPSAFGLGFRLRGRTYT